MKWRRGPLLCVLMVMPALLVGCRSTQRIQSPEQPVSAPADGWQAMFRGIDYRVARVEKPRTMVWYALRVDLEAAGIGFLVTPPNGKRRLETDGLTTSHFLDKYRCQAAINAAPFGPVLQTEGQPHDVTGLAISRGKTYSAQQPGFGALLITRNNRAWIARQPTDAGKAYNAVGGFEVILENGKNVGTDSPLHPRTAVGVSQLGRYLYLAVVDGRQPGYSEGASTAELAAFMHQLGAHSALNLDGGGTSTMVVAGSDGRPQVLNRPIHLHQPGTERVSGSHLGVYARPLKR